MLSILKFKCDGFTAYLKVPFVTQSPKKDILTLSPFAKVCWKAGGMYYFFYSALALGIC